MFTKGIFYTHERGNILVLPLRYIVPGAREEDLRTKGNFGIEGLSESPHRVMGIVAKAGVHRE